MLTIKGLILGIWVIVVKKSMIRRMFFGTTYIVISVTSLIFQLHYIETRVMQIKSTWGKIKMLPVFSGRCTCSWSL